MQKDSWNSNIYAKQRALQQSWNCVKEEEGIAVMKWPLQSPDMNPIENVGKIIGGKVQNRNPQNIDDLWERHWPSG